jgi:peptidoglycan hydrolase-like protein with peptidoglycan-binding domain
VEAREADLPVPLVRPRRWRAWSVALVVAGAVAVVAVVAWPSGSRRVAPGGPARTTATAVVSRRTLVQRETVDGTLGLAGRRELSAGLTGTFTDLPAAGTTIRRGGTVYRVDEQPVVLMYGAVPAYRELARGVSKGDDVRQLETNLVALGFDPNRSMTVDEHFTAATAAAVKRWQRSAGLPRTGRVELGRVVFLPSARRVGTVKASAGDRAQPGAPVLETTATRRVVTIDLDAAKQTYVRRGNAVRVLLPNGDGVRGRIASVGRVAQQNPDRDSGGSVIRVTVRLRSGARVSHLDQAPVSVSIARQRTRDALSVPVTALLPLAGGRYAVEVVHGARLRLVAVRPGAFAGGYVQVSGSGLRPGMRVAVPR